MADNLTLQFKEELEERARKSSSQSVFTPTAPSGTQGGGSMWEALQRPEADDGMRKEGALNALGAGLWSFADTYAFGVPGAFVEEEKFIDFEDPLAKWTSAFGGFIGFVAGAPMKIGAKVVAKVAQPFIKKAGRRSIDSVVREMKTIGVDQKLGRSTIREATTGYRTLALKSGVDKRLRGEKFTEAAEDYLSAFLDKARIGESALTMGQKVSVSKMFGNAIKTRPINDFKGLMALRGVDSRFQRVIGHALNDAVMFGAIDTIFEGVSTIEDHEFDWTAPLWGVANGIAFSQLSWLNPSGKRAKWNVDFKLGLKAAFSKDIYTRMGKTELAASAKFMGESYFHNGAKTGSRKILFKGEEKTVNLLADDLLQEIKQYFPKAKPEDVLKSFLNKERVKWGKDMMKWSTIEEADALRENWMRMIAGGLLFNAHSFVDMYMHGYEPDVSDILPHFLIGAYVQRKSNPSKFDMNDAKMTRMRQNMMILGFHPDQLADIPTFMYKNTRFKNFFNDPKNKSILDLMESEGLISDSYEAVSEKSPPGEKTLGIPENINPLFENLYREMIGRQGFPKTFGAITVKTQNKILKEFRKIHGDVTEVEASEIFEKSYDESTENFDREFINTLIKIKDAAVNNEPDMDMTYNPGNPSKSKMPAYVGIDEAIINKARKGELKFLKDPKDRRKTLKGEEAVEELKNKIEGLNKIILMTNSLNQTTPLPGGEQRTIKTEAFTESMYKEMKIAESKINSLFPDKSQLAAPFTFSEYWNDYNRILLDNHTKKFSKGIQKVFKQDYVEKDKLATKLFNAGVLHRTGEGEPNRLIDSVMKIKITGTEDAERIAEALRVIHRALNLQTNSGGYHVIEDTLFKKGGKEVSIDDVDALNTFLSERTGGALDLKTINDRLHHKIADFILKDAIEGSGLRTDQADVFFNLAGTGFARFESAVKGKAGGFQIRLVDEKTLPTSADENASLKESAIEYNKYVRTMIQDSKGLVAEWGDPIQRVDKTVMQDLYNTVTKNYDVKYLARVELMKLANITSVNYAEFSTRLSAFANAGHESYAFKWLTQMGVFKYTGKDKTEIQIIEEKFNKEIEKKMLDIMSRHGVSAKYSERIYKEHEEIARESIMAEEDMIDYNPRMDMQTFFSRYRIGNETSYEEMSDRDLKKMQSSFDDMIYVGADQESRVLHIDSVRKVLKNIWVEHNGEWKHLDTLAERDQYRPQLTRDMIGLLWQQSAQMKVKVVGYERGSLTSREEVMNKTRFTELMLDVDIPFTIVDPTAFVYEMVDNRYMRRRYLNMYGDSGNLTKKEREFVELHQKKFESLLKNRESFEGEPTRGEDETELGLHIVALSRGMSTIAVLARNLHKIYNPFKEFVKRYDIEAVEPNETKKYRNLVEKINAEEVLTPQEYSYMLRRIMFEKMLVGSDGNRTFLEFLNGERVEKLMSRSKLFNTKKFVRTGKQFIDDARVALLETAITSSQKRAANVLRKYSHKNGFGVAIWNDVEYAPLIASADAWAKKLKLDWRASDIIGDAHAEKSKYDSIGFISRDMMTLLHTLLGHKFNSTNPLKPVITSGGPDSPLLLGKTLFIYSPAMNATFGRNKSVDIVITKSGSKVYNPKGVEGEGPAWDTSIINKEISHLITENGLHIGSGKIRKITLESLGVMPMKDTYESSASEGMSDYNYASNKEHGRIFKEMYETQMNTNMDWFVKVAKDPIRMRQWILSTMGDEGVSPSPESGEAMNHLSNMHLFSSLTRDANPMSFSENILKNKMYGMYMHGVLNNKRSVINQWTQKEVQSAENYSPRYGGQAYFMQAPEHDLRPTLINRDGVMLARGEAMLPFADMETRIADLVSTHGMEFRFVKGTEILKPEDALGSDIITVKGKKKTVSKWQLFLDGDGTLGTLFKSIELGKKNNLYDKDLQIGVIVKRFPRTRPNDMSVLALKGFLAEEYGRAIAVNSLDVANVYEGDYDADKADYLFAAKKSFYAHVERASQFLVQGIDVEKLQTRNRFVFNGAPATEDAAIRKMIADDNVWKQSIGIVQKIPRKLSFLSHLGSVEAKPNLDPYVRDYIRDVKGESFVPRSLLRGEGKDGPYKIIMDFNNLDFYTRSALETQYIIDGKGDLNKDIASSIRHWGDTFLFPKIEDSKSSSEIEKIGVGFVNDMRVKGNSFEKRVRIFRRIEMNEEGNFVEKELSSLDKAMIKELMSEYGNFLNSTGKENFGKAGEKNRATFDGVMSGSHKFFTFNENIKDGLYYRLRNRRIDPSIEKSKKWSEDKEFKKLFGVKEQPKYKDKSGKEVRWWKSEESPIEESVFQNAKEIAVGKRGSVLERMLYRMYDADPFEQIHLKGLTGEVRGIMNDWYNQIVEGTYGDYGNATKILREKVTTAAFKINDAIDTIASMQKQVMLIQHNSSIPYKIKAQKIDDANKVIKEMLSKIEPMIPKSYWKSRRAKELFKAKVKFVSVEEKNLIEGAIHYASINNLRQALGGSPTFGLNTDAIALLKEIKHVRKLFYGNFDSLKDVLKYKDTTVLSEEMQEFLSKMPELSTVHDIENSLLLKGYNAHHIKFIYAFMDPGADPTSIGVFDNQVVPVPFQASKRYSRGIKFLTQMMTGFDKEASPVAREQWVKEKGSVAESALKMLQTVEGDWRRFYTRKIDQRGISETIANIGAPEVGDLALSHVKMPDFHRDFTKTFTSFSRIDWRRDTDRIGIGSGLMNDHLIQFYSDIMNLAGKGDDFTSYLQRMNALQSDMMSNRTMHPIKYLSIRSLMDKEVREIAERVLTGGLVDKNNTYVKNIINNPVYAIMGGVGHYKGLSLEKRNFLDRNELKDIIRMNENLKGYDKDLNVKSSSSKKQIREAIAKCLEGK